MQQAGSEMRNNLSEKGQEITRSEKISGELSLSEKENDKSDKFQRVWGEQRTEVEKHRVELPAFFLWETIQGHFPRIP